MSTGWSLWVIGLMVLNLTIVIFLFFWATSVEIPTEKDGTSGHQWAHGVLRESVRKLPSWWYVVSLGSLLFPVIYFTLYPGFGNYPGILGWTSDGNLQEQQNKNIALQKPLMERAMEVDIAILAQDKQAIRAAQRLFIDNCAGCHGYEGKGIHAIGAPDLTANTWLYGDTDEDILKSIRDGRIGIMPGWKHMGYGKVKNLAHYVRRLSGDSHDSEAARVAKTDFKNNCAVCHGNDGKGIQALGAPDLTDNASLYGNSLDQLMISISEGRSGVMPGWSERLSEAEIRLLAAWIRANDSL